MPLTISEKWFVPFAFLALVSCGRGGNGSSTSNDFASVSNTTPLQPMPLPKECELRKDPFVIDAQAPVLELLGEKIVTVAVGANYSDAGATAFDPQDGNVTSTIKVTGLDKVDTGKVGDYLIRYEAMDTDNHVGRSRTRIVRVNNGIQPKYTLREFGALNSPMGFLEHLPTFFGTEPNVSYPLIIFAHGWGHYVQQSPETNRLVTLLYGANIYRVFDENLWPDTRPFIVLEPQRCDSEQVGDVEWQQVDQFIEWALATYPIDVERIYMMGLSAGGYFTYRYPVLFPNRLAAIAPMSAGGPVETDPSRTDFCAAMKHMPIWAFHGDADKTVPLDHTLFTFEILTQRCPEQPTPAPLLTVVTRGNHVIIDRIDDDSYIGQGDPKYTVQGQSLYDWFLQYSRFK